MYVPILLPVFIRKCKNFAVLNKTSALHSYITLICVVKSALCIVVCYNLYPTLFLPFFTVIQLIKVIVQNQSLSFTLKAFLTLCLRKAK